MRTMSPVPSVLSSSTTMISHFGYSVLSSVATHVLMLGASLRAGTITDTSGACTGEIGSARESRTRRRRMMGVSRRMTSQGRARTRSLNPGMSCSLLRALTRAYLARVHNQDWQQWRAEFPILERRTYLNSCSLGALSRRALARINTFHEDWHNYGA